MTSWETCAIDEILVRKKKAMDGLFSIMNVLVQQWEAKIIDSSGSRTILKSEEYVTRMKSELMTKDFEIRKAAYDKLIAQLLSDGWEPISTDQYGWITLMKRQISSSQDRQTPEATDLLRQLSNLRDAGILTEQEFQNKKAEILKGI